MKIPWQTIWIQFILFKGWMLTNKELDIGVSLKSIRDPWITGLPSKDAIQTLIYKRTFFLVTLKCHFWNLMLELFCFLDLFSSKVCLNAAFNPTLISGSVQHQLL